MNEEINQDELADLNNHTPAVDELLLRTGYQIDRTSSCRIYGGPPPNFTGEEPSEDCQVGMRTCLFEYVTLSF